MVQALMGQSSATHQLFCKSASAAGCAGAAYTRAASLLSKNASFMIALHLHDFYGASVVLAKENSRWRASGTSAAALLFWKEVCHGYMKHL